MRFTAEQTAMSSYKGYGAGRPRAITPQCAGRASARPSYHCTASCPWRERPRMGSYEMYFIRSLLTLIDVQSWSGLARDTLALRGAGAARWVQSARRRRSGSTCSNTSTLHRGSVRAANVSTPAPWCSVHSQLPGAGSAVARCSRSGHSLLTSRRASPNKNAQRCSRWALPLLGSNQDSPDPEGPW
jgi:hypothetical protein